jgi:hypothetical protein
MLTISSLVGGCLTVLVLLQAAPAAAQSTFGNLDQKVRKGQRVIVVDDKGAITEGTVDEVSSSALVVDYFRGRLKDPSLDTRRTFTPRDVWKIQKKAHLWDGAIKGAAVGLIPAVIALRTQCYGCGLGGFAAFSITVGAAAGVGIDALSGPKTIYRRDGAGPRIALAPALGPNTRGIAASIRF